MSKTKTVYTLQTLLDRTTEEGDCRLWTGYAQNGAPMVFHDGKLIQVRKLVLILTGVTLRGQYTACRCGDPLCVAPAHIVQRTVKEHHTLMGLRVSQSSSNPARVAKITKARRGKLAKITQEQANEIRCSDESGPVLGARYGITKSQVRNIKIGRSWNVSLDFGNPFAGLGAR